MKVDNPRFGGSAGMVYCDDCPFTDDECFCNSDSRLYGLCTQWGREHNPTCPTADTYAEACKLAEEAPNA